MMTTTAARPKTKMKPRFRVKTVEVPVNSLSLHLTANRERTTAQRIAKLEREMDLDKLGRFAAWREARTLYVIDGQHRKIALENLGMGDWVVRCDVYEGLTFQDACDIFLGLNDSLLVRPFDRFDKAMKAGYEAEVECTRIVREAGLEISSKNGDGRVACVSAVTDVWGIDRGESLARALRLTCESWGSISQALEGNTLRGLGLLVSKYNGELDEAVLIKKLSKFPGGPGALLGRAKAQRDIKGGTVSRNIAAIIVDIYNKGRRTSQLPPL